MTNIPIPASIDDVGYYIGPEIVDNFGIALVMLTEAGNYFDDGFESILTWEIMVGFLFLLGFAMNIYLISYNFELWYYRKLVSYNWPNWDGANRANWAGWLLTNGI